MAVVYYREPVRQPNCLASGTIPPEGTRLTHPLKRRQRAECPICRKLVALTKQGALFVHWRWAWEGTEGIE